MPSVFYKNSSGRVVRRVYRSIDELDTMLQNTVRGTATNHYSEAELLAMKLSAEEQAAVRDARKQEVIDLAANAPKNRDRLAATNNVKSRLSTRHARDEAAKMSGIAVGFIPGVGQIAASVLGLVAASLTGSLSGEIDDAAAQRIDLDLARMRAAYLDLQATLREEWLAQKNTARLFELVTGEVRKNINLQAEMALQDADRAAVAPAVVAIADTIATAPSAGAANAALEARLAQLEASNEQLRQNLEQRDAEAAVKNTVTTVKTASIDLLVPTTKEEKENHESSRGWVGPLTAAVAAFAIKQGANPAAKAMAKKLANDLYQGAIGFKFKADNRAKYEARWAEIQAKDGQATTAADGTARERQQQGAALKARLEALENHPHMLRSYWTKAFGRVESWGLGTNKSGDTLGGLTKMVGALEAGVTNPRSPFYKE